MPELRDPSIGLSCEETPFYMPKVMALNDIPVCTSCSLIFSAPVTATKYFSSRKGLDGINVDESPLAEFSYNTNKYGLYDTVLWKKGAHRNFKASDTYDLEMNLYFRDIFNPKQQVAIAIPITIDDSKANPYFTEMAKQNINVRRMSLENIISSGSVLMYKGMDLRNRNSTDNETAEQCKSKSASLTWFVLQSAFISKNDAQTIRQLTLESNVLPPRPLHETTLERARNMSSSVATIQLKSAKEKLTKKTDEDKGIYLTRALQCQRINPLTDLKNDAVYLNGTEKNTLDDELNTETELLTSENTTSIRPRQIEKWLSGIFGMIFGILLFVFIAHYILQILFKSYLPHEISNSIAMPAIVDAKAAACAQYSSLTKT